MSQKVINEGLKYLKEFTARTVDTKFGFINSSSWVDVATERDNNAQIDGLLKQVSLLLTTVQPILNKTHFSFLINKTPNLITTAFKDKFYQIKKIDESGAQSLIMIVKVLESAVAKLFGMLFEDEDDIQKKLWNCKKV